MPYSPYVRPITSGGVRCAVVDKRLAERTELARLQRAGGTA